LLLYVVVVTALHHNNCMYVAHHLITIDKVFQRRLSAADAPVLGGPTAPASARSQPLLTSPGPGVAPMRLHPGPRDSGSPSGSPGWGTDGGGSKLMEVVVWVKRLGNDNFTQHVNVKKQQLVQHLRAAKGNCFHTDKI